MEPSRQRQQAQPQAPYNNISYPGHLPDPVSTHASGQGQVQAPTPAQVQNQAHPAHTFSFKSPVNSPSVATFPPSSTYNQYGGDTSAYDDDTNDANDDRAESGQGDPKRRRIARACDMCRKKKIKCDGKAPKCSHCENYKTECIFTQVEKKRNPPKGAKYIEGLENRLGRMEAMLRLAGLLGEDDRGKTDLGTLEKRLADKAAAAGSAAVSSLGSPPAISPSVARERSVSAHPTPLLNGGLSSPKAASQTPEGHGKAPDSRDPEQVEALADAMCSLVTNSCGETRYIGSSSGFSIFSPKGIQWVNEKTGDTSFHDMISQAAADDRHWAHWKPEIFGDIFQRKTYRPLPPKAEALALLKDFFSCFNCIFPLFHEPTFMHLVDRHYSLEPYEGSGWWASLNVALAIAHRLRVMSDAESREEDLKAWGYLKNALAVQAELTLRNNDLLSVQALLGMAMFMQGTPNPQPGFFLVSAALRLAHSIGLHKRGSDFNLNPVESEQRKRVFWIAYILDKDICLRSGRPPVQDDEDMNVDLPSENPPDNIGNVPLGDGRSKLNLFRVQCVFATIQSKVYKNLYSVKASRQSDGELLNTIGELDQELETWKDSIPVEFRPEHEIEVTSGPLALHIVTLHFGYYNCLTTIHRMSVHHGYWTSRLSNYAIAGLNARPLNPRVFMSAALCVNAARTSISLVKHIPRGDHACVWLILYYPISALVTLFANILQNPQDARARSDLKLMDSVVQFLGLLCQEDPNSHCRRMLSICSEFERIARVALDKAEREIRVRGKRKAAPEKDSKASTATLQQQHQRKASQKATGQALQTPQLQTSYLPDGSKMSMEDSPAMPTTNTQNSSPYGPQIPYSGATPSQFPADGTMNQAWLNPIGSQTQAPPTDFTSTLFQPSNLGVPDYGFSNTDTGIDGSFQQPFVPQDLWQMPMTLEWDWADVFNTSPGFNFDDSGNMNDISGQQAPQR